MIIGVLKEDSNENRVALNPDGVALLIKNGVAKILVEKGAGELSHLSNEAYAEKGATISDEKTILEQADLIVKIHPPHQDALEQLNEKQVLLGQLGPLGECHDEVRLDHRQREDPSVPRDAVPLGHQPA